MTVKRCPYSVGDKINYHDMTTMVNKKLVPMCGGFEVEEINRLNMKSGGYIVSLRGLRAIEGEQVKASFTLFFPKFRNRARRAYVSSFRYWVGDMNKVAKQVNNPSRKQSKQSETVSIAKKVVLDNGHRKRMVLADFLED